MNTGATGEGSPLFHQLLAGGGDFLGKGAIVFMGTLRKAMNVVCLDFSEDSFFRDEQQWATLSLHYSLEGKKWRWRRRNFGKNTGREANNCREAEWSGKWQKLRLGHFCRWHHRHDHCHPLPPHINTPPLAQELEWSSPESLCARHLYPLPTLSYTILTATLWWWFTTWGKRLREVK